YSTQVFPARLECAMRVVAGILVLVVWLSPQLVGQSPNRDSGTSPSPAVRDVLSRIRAADKGQLAVSEEDGRFLRILVASTSARRVLEIGGASGYSGIWM